MAVSEIRILVADDQRNVRGNLKMILEAAGYRVDKPADARDSFGEVDGAHDRLSKRLRS
jgi:PleD family two-component response regulator